MRGDRVDRHAHSNPSTTATRKRLIALVLIIRETKNRNSSCTRSHDIRNIIC